MKEQNPRVRMLMLGFPKSGKTGALASLINAGYEVGILDFDHNLDPLYAFVNKDKYQNVSIITLDDPLEDKDDKKIVVKGTPSAFRNAMRAIDNWKDDEGREWGPVRDWGPNRILVLDSMTRMGEAGFRRRRAVRSSGRMGEDQEADWGAAQRDQMNFIEHIVNPRFSCHVLVLGHLQTIEPKILRESSRDPDDIRKAKAAISKLRAENAKIRNYPRAIGQAIAPEIGGFLPAIVLVDGNRQGKRKIITSGEPDLDLGVPAPHIAKMLPLETGLVTIFDAILGTGKGMENGETEEE